MDLQQVAAKKKTVDKQGPCSPPQVFNMIGLVTRGLFLMMRRREAKKMRTEVTIF